MQDLGTLGGTTDSEAYGINASGEVVGYSWTRFNAAFHAFLYSGGVMHDLRTLGGTYSDASGINASGQVVGWSDTSGDAAYHAFLYSGGVMHDVGTLGTESRATGINSSGQVVGNALIPSSGFSHAFLYSGGVTQDLNSLISPLSGWNLYNATAINDLGQIVGYGFNSSGQIGAFLLSPVPEPDGVALAALALAGFMLLARQVRR